MKDLFIVNPKAGNGDGYKKSKVIEAVLKERETPYEMIYTKYPLHAIEIARSYKQSDDVRIFAVGGDGTLNEVLNGINVGVPLGIIPCGSGNDFFKMITRRSFDFKTMLRDTLDGTIEKVDYGILNGRKFMNSFSVGIDATINRKAKILQTKSRLKAGAYMQSALLEVLHPIPMHVTLELEDQSITKDALLISSLNGKWYGGGFMPAPSADIRDGLFEVSMIDYIPTLKILPLFPRYMIGKHIGASVVSVFRANRFTLHTRDLCQAQIDGELIEGTHFELQVIHQGLPLIIPKGEQYGPR